MYIQQDALLYTKNFIQRPGKNPTTNLVQYNDFTKMLYCER